jgi:hypothetical protein
MTFLLILPTILAVVTLGAHYLRYGLYPLTAVLVAVLPLLFIGRRWVARLMQVVLVIAAVEWVTVLNDIIKERVMEGQPYQKSVFILGGTALFTLFAAVLYQTPQLRRRYGAATTTAPEP